MARSHEIIGNSDPENNTGEAERYTLRPLRELDLNSQRDLEDYFRLLAHPDNVEHFANPPVDADDLKEKLIRDATHAYLIETQEGTVIGGGGINDAAETEHDHFLVKAVIDPTLQGQGLGSQLIANLTEKAFFTRTDDGRTRTKLDAAIIRNVRGWERMPRILERLGFRPLHIMLGQVDVYDSQTERMVIRPTERWEITRYDWFRMRRRRDISQLIIQ